MEQYQRNNQYKANWDRPKKQWKPKPQMPQGCRYYVEVRDGEDPMRAYRKIKKKMKDDKFIEEFRERQYYRKPSFKRREKRKKRAQVLRRLQRDADSDRFMGGRKR